MMLDVPLVARRGAGFNSSAAAYRAGIFGVGLFLTFSTQVAFAQGPDVVHPCKDDHDLTWYFALGKTVFERMAPFDFSHSFGSTVTDLNPLDTLRPPDPKAPSGCKDNPQQLKAYDTSGWPKFGSHNYPARDFPGQMADGPSQLTLYVVQTPASKQKMPINQIFYPWPLCDRLPFHKTFADGTIYCINTRAGLANPEDNSSIYDLQSSSAAYTLQVFPLRQGLRVQNEFDGEDVGYFFTEHIGIMYHTQYGSPSLSILETKAIDFDRAIRDSLIKSEVQNYPWPQH